MICASRVEPSVTATAMAWVSPRVNKAEPCALGRISDFAGNRTNGAVIPPVDTRLTSQDTTANDLLLKAP